MGNILTIAEQRKGELRRISLELLNVGRLLAEKTDGKVESAVVGNNVDGLAVTLGHHGADKVYLLNHADLEMYSPDGYAKVVADLIIEKKPAIVLLGASAFGKDLGARLAARLGVGLASDSIAVEVDSANRLSVIRPMYAGRVMAKVRLKADPQMVSIRPNIFKPLPEKADKAAEVEKIAVDPGVIMSKTVRLVETAQGKIELTEANTVVAGGRGLKGPENFPLLDALADKLRAAVGASRAAVDAGWIDHDAQVGQTGKVVNPTLYIAAGISGAIQHLAGMTASKVIVAINKDPEAPIFKVADYGIVDDLFKIIPLLTKELE